MSVNLGQVQLADVGGRFTSGFKDGYSTMRQIKKDREEDALKEQIANIDKEQVKEHDLSKQENTWKGNVEGAAQNLIEADNGAADSIGKGFDEQIASVQAKGKERLTAAKFNATDNNPEYVQLKKNQAELSGLADKIRENNVLNEMEPQLHSQVLKAGADAVKADLENREQAVTQPVQKKTDEALAALRADKARFVGVANERVASARSGLEEASSLYSRAYEGIPKQKFRVFNGQVVSEDFDADAEKAIAKDAAYSARGLPSDFYKKYAEGGEMRRAVRLRKGMEALGKEQESWDEVQRNDPVNHFNFSKKEARLYAGAGELDKARSTANDAALKLGVLGGTAVLTDPVGAAKYFSALTGKEISDVTYNKDTDSIVTTVDGKTLPPVSFEKFVAAEILPYAKTNESLAWLKNEANNENRLAQAIAKLTGGYPRPGGGGKGGSGGSVKPEKEPDFFPHAKEVEGLYKERASSLYPRLMTTLGSNRKLAATTQGRATAMRLVDQVESGTLKTEPFLDDQLRWQEAVPLAPNSPEKVIVTDRAAFRDGVQFDEKALPAITRADLERKAVARFAPGFLNKDTFAATREKIDSERLRAESAVNKHRSTLDQSRGRLTKDEVARIESLIDQQEEIAKRNDRLLTLGTKYSPSGKPLADTQPSDFETWKKSYGQYALESFRTDAPNGVTLSQWEKQLFEEHMAKK